MCLPLPSVPRQEQGERGRGFGGGGGGDTLADESPPSPNHLRLKISSYHHVDDRGEGGEDRVPSLAPSPPHAKRRREEREQGTDCSRAPDFQGNLPGIALLPESAHDHMVTTAVQRLPACGLPRCRHCLS